jgi:putative acetyltransferase
MNSFYRRVPRSIAYGNLLGVVSFRDATLGDALPLHHLHRAAIDRRLRSHYGDGPIDRWLARCDANPTRFEAPLASGIARVAEADGVLVGLCLYEPMPRTLSLWYVHPEFAGQGIGGRLLREVEDTVRRLSPGAVWLHATRDSEPRFRRYGWHHVGWQACGRFAEIPAALMVKDLTVR